MLEHVHLIAGCGKRDTLRANLSPNPIDSERRRRFTHAAARLDSGVGPRRRSRNEAQLKEIS